MKRIKKIYKLLLCISAIILICFVSISTNGQLKQRIVILAPDKQQKNNESLLRDQINLQNASNKQNQSNGSSKQLNVQFDNLSTVQKNATHDIKEKYTYDTQANPVTALNVHKNATNGMKKENQTEPKTENASHATSKLEEEYSNNAVSNLGNASNNHENATGKVKEEYKNNDLAITNTHTNETNANKKENTNIAQANTENASNVQVSLTGNSIRGNKKLKIGILIPSSTFNIQNPVLNKLSLTTICLPSLYNTFDKQYLYQIYVGIDQGDYLETVQNEIARLFSNITVVILTTRKKSFTRSVNLIARKAYEDEVDYFVRINDDTSFETTNWTSSALDILLSYKPPNVGVVGPVCEEGNIRILTHDMVHRTHFEIFGFYYPVYFNNWWTDDWMTKVYQPERSTQIDSWLVKHHTGFHKRRYNVKLKKFAQLEGAVADGRSRVAEYLKKTV